MLVWGDSAARIGAVCGRLEDYILLSEANGVQAVESSGSVFEDGKPLVSSELHAMTIAFGHQALGSAARLLVLPMGTGKFTLHTQRAFVNPVLLMGEIVGGRWKQYAVKSLQRLSFAVDAELSLSMLLICEDADRAGTVTEMEVWMTTPWKLEAGR